MNIEYLHELPNINIYKNYPKTLYRYNKFLTKVKPDYIIDIGVNLGLETLPVSVFRGIRVISWEHFNANVFHNYIVNSISKFLAATFSYKLVVLTDQDEKVYQKKFFAKNTLIIPYPVAIDVKGYSYNAESKQVLTIGRLANQKGLDYLLDAWKIVNNKYKDWKLKIVGDGELKNELLDQCSSLDLNEVVEFVSSSPDVVQHFKNSSIYAMSSRYEGLPLVLIEAKCFGLPIVSFDCETGPRQIIRDNIDGLLVKTEQPSLLAQAIISLIESPYKRQEFNKNALMDAQRFSPEVFFEKWKQLLKAY